MLDPYLNHVQKLNQKITDQIIESLGTPPENVAKAIYDWKEVDVSGFALSDNGLFLPASQQPKPMTYTNCCWGPSPMASLAKAFLAMKQVSASNQDSFDSIFGMPVAVCDTFDPYRRAREQQLLRRANGRQDEYVWSDVLKAHVRIGEDLPL